VILFVRAASSLPESTPESIEEAAALTRILAAQRQILALDDQPVWQAGRLKSVAAVLINLSKTVDDVAVEGQIEAALSASLASGGSAPLLDWLNAHESQFIAQPDSASAANASQMNADAETVDLASGAETIADKTGADSGIKYGRRADDGVKFGRRAEDSQTGPRSLKVDQAKIDRLMNLIGELVVEKNALPYLAQRAETQYGVRELSREIKGQYSVINRIADEMQDAIMQVRMMAVSFVFQRFPRLVRDISRKARQGSATGARRRADRGRQEHHRVAGRPLDSYSPQQPRPRPGNSRGPARRASRRPEY
jgi:two-component system chemotaxis sensor kinase CheA